MNDNHSLMNKFKADPKLMEQLVEKANTTTKPVLTNHGSPHQRVYTPKKIEERVAQYEQEAKIREQALKNQISFIAPQFDGVFSLTRGLVLVGAKPGHSKSTTAANILAYFLEQEPTGDAIVISNEEASEAVFNRIACSLLKKSFLKFHRGELGERDKEEVREMVPKIAKRIEVIDDGAWDMTVLEDVIGVLEYAASQKIRMVVLDYLQTVNTSSTYPDWEAIQISKKLGFYLKAYGKRVTIPVVVFAQLSPLSISPDIAARFQNDKTIYNHAFSVVEIVPDFVTRTTSFVIHKDRFGDVQGKQVVMGFKDGRYVPLEYDI